MTSTRTARHHGTCESLPCCSAVLGFRGRACRRSGVSHGTCELSSTIGVHHHGTYEGIAVGAAVEPRAVSALRTATYRRTGRGTCSTDRRAGAADRITRAGEPACVIGVGVNAPHTAPFVQARFGTNTPVPALVFFTTKFTDWSGPTGRFVCDPLSGVTATDVAAETVLTS